MLVQEYVEPVRDLLHGRPVLLTGADPVDGASDEEDEIVPDSEEADRVEVASVLPIDLHDGQWLRLRYGVDPNSVDERTERGIGG